MDFDQKQITEKNLSIVLTPRAIAQIHKLQNKDRVQREHLNQSNSENFDRLKSKCGLHLKLSVESGGCSGMQYIFSLEPIIDENSFIISQENAILLVDKASALFLTNIEIDYVEEMIGSQFEVKNPNATASCSCGVSFSLF